MLPKVCKDNIDVIVAHVPNGVDAENAVNGANISSISVQRFIVTTDAARYYQAMDRTPTRVNMHYTNVLKVSSLSGKPMKQSRMKMTRKSLGLMIVMLIGKSFVGLQSSSMLWKTLVVLVVLFAMYFLSDKILD